MKDRIFPATGKILQKLFRIMKELRKDWPESYNNSFWTVPLCLAQNPGILNMYTELPQIENNFGVFGGALCFPEVGQVSVERRMYTDWSTTRSSTSSSLQRLALESPFFHLLVSILVLISKLPLSFIQVVYIVFQRFLRAFITSQLTTFGMFCSVVMSGLQQLMVLLMEWKELSGGAARLQDVGLLIACRHNILTSMLLWASPTSASAFQP